MQTTSGGLPRMMLTATIALVVITLGLTVAAGPVYRYTERAGVDVLDRDSYITAVLGGTDLERATRSTTSSTTSSTTESRWTSTPTARGARP